jgi:hypothetical protein
MVKSEKKGFRSLIMNTTQTINELLQVLADRGLSDDAIVNVRDGLWAQANETFMDEVLSSLKDEDLQQVEASGTQEEANQKFMQLYQEKTGKDMQEEMNKIVDQYATDLIAKYKIEDGVTLPVSYSSDAGSENADEKFFPSGDTGLTSETADIPELPPAPKQEDEEKVHDLN